MRPIRIDGEVAFVQLTQGKEALIDAADAQSVGEFNWFAVKSRKTFYAARQTRISSGKQRMQSLHSFILGAKDGSVIDHRNGDGLDNRRDNIRVSSRAQNAWNQGLSRNNTSGFKGVDLHSQSLRWQARIRWHGKHHFLGFFDSPEEAHNAYCKAAERLHGEFARTK